MYTPPAPPISGAIARLILQVDCNGQRCENTLDYMYSASLVVGQTDLSALATAWSAAFKTDFLACLPPTANFAGIYTSSPSVASCPSYQFTYTGAQPGTAGATALPLEMGVTVARYAALKGRHGRGRITMPAVPNTFTTPATDPNMVNAAGLVAYRAFAADLGTNVVVAGGTWSPVISTRPVPPNQFVTNAAPVTTFQVRIILGTARRRKPGRGI